jgi:hypothetical protein
MKNKYRVDAWVITEDPNEAEKIFSDILSQLRDAKTQRKKILNGHVTRVEITEPEEYSEGV